MQFVNLGLVFDEYFFLIDMQNKNAFSLIEIAMVLLIVVLLIAGFTGGLKLTEKAEISRMIKEINYVETAYNSFVAVYGQPPGDFSRAADIWGATVTSGNGDIEVDSGTESTQAALHLKAAGLIKNDDDLAIQAFNASEVIIYNASNDFIYADAVNLLHIGAADNIDNALLLPYQQEIIDIKIDDGLSQTGVMSYKVAGNVTDVTCSSGSGYDLDGIAVGCNIVYELD